MESPAPRGTDVTRIAARSSVIESLKGCGLPGVRIDKEELRRKILIPQYLRQAMRDAIASRDHRAGDRHFANAGAPEVAPESPMVVFINSRSGGRHGPELKGRLQELMSEEQVRFWFPSP